MASSLALKRLLSSNLAAKSLSSPLRPVANASRRFNTNALRNDSEGHELERVDNRRPDNFLSDVFDPFSPTRSLSQVLNLMDQLTANPFLSGGVGGGVQRGWEAKETEEALNLRVDMPGLGKDDVKVSVDQGTLTIKGESHGEEGGVRRYMSRIELPERMYRVEEIKAEMRNGVLNVVVPKLKEDERSDVFHVNVE